MYKKLGLESLKFKRYFRRLCIFFKIQQSGLPSHFFNLIPQSNHISNTRQSDKVESFHCRKNAFRNSFFPCFTEEWHKLKPEITIVELYLKFRKLILNLDNCRPISNPIYNVFNLLGLKYLTRVRLELSHLNEHRFKRNFQDCTVSCSLEPETHSYFFPSLPPVHYFTC